MDFNDIKNAWKDSFKDEELLNKKEIEAKLKIKSKSNTALNKVKRNYKFELILGVTLFIFIIVYLFINITPKNKVLIISLATLFMGSLFSFTWINFKRIKDIIISSDQLKPTLVKTISYIQKYVNFNKSSFAKFILFPFAILFGMFLGLQMGSGEKKFIEIFALLENDALIKIILTFVIGSLIMIPISQFLNKKLYNQHLDELKQCLKEFEEIEE